VVVLGSIRAFQKQDECMHDPEKHTGLLKDAKALFATGLQIWNSIRALFGWYGEENYAAELADSLACWSFRIDYSCLHFSIL